jgi:hypothetical protein
LKKIVFEQTKLGDAIIGTFDSKKGQYNDIKKAKIPDKNKSTVCTIM